MIQTMKAVHIGSNKELIVADTPRPRASIGEVLVAIQAAGINRADLMQRQGLYPPPADAPSIMGLECAGIVEAIGEGVKRFKKGDRVCALLAGGGYAEYAAVDEGSVLPIPDNLTFVEAACFPEAMMTVWSNVFQRCKFQSGESFLVHGGTSGIGVMAIQMARFAGAGAIFATAGSDEKCAKCEELGSTLAINYNKTDFAEVVTRYDGVDVILDMVGGDYVQRNLDIVRSDGRICNIAFQNGHTVTVNMLKLMLKRAFLTGSTLRARSNQEKQFIRNAVEKDFWGATEKGTIKPILDAEFPLSRVDEAQERMRKGGHIGKIVLTT